MQGWPLVGVVAVLVGLMIGAIFAAYGTGEAGLHAGLRATAATSTLLFLAAFLASGLRRAQRSEATKWLIRNRRYVGVSMAASHTWHLGLIVALARTTGEPYDTATLAGGGLAYVFIVLMVATSFDTTTRWLGARRWRRLHTTGMYWLWVVFAVTYLGGVAYRPVSALFFALLLAGLVARLVLKRRGSSLRRPAVRDGVIG